MKRKRGGQQGNQNARKHGFYCKALGEARTREFRQAVRVKGLDEEIALLRLKLRSLAENDPGNLKLIGKDVGTLAHLLRASHAIRDNGADLDRISRNLRELFRSVYPDSPFLDELDTHDSQRQNE